MKSHSWTLQMTTFSSTLPELFLLKTGRFHLTMVITHRRASLRIISCLSLVAALTVGGGAAHAQQLSAAPDGQQFRSKSAATQRDFVGAFGQSCAPQEWVWQHSLAVNADDFNGDPAAD